MKRGLRTSWLCVAAMFLSACSSTPAPPAEWNDIRLGMSQSEVRSRLGEAPESHRVDKAPTSQPRVSEWCRTLDMVEVDWPCEFWVYRSGETQSLTLGFDDAGNVIWNAQATSE